MKEQYTNSKQWQDNSDAWVAMCTKSKENKEKYMQYVAEKRYLKPLSYLEWLKENA